MITIRQLAPLFIALALGSTPLLAQPAPPKKAEEPASHSAENSTPTKQTQTMPAPAPAEPAKKSTPAEGSKNSPFEYHSSEEISEDVPVSFPVDI
jgi:hypothetical protein